MTEYEAQAKQFLADCNATQKGNLHHEKERYC